MPITALKGYERNPRSHGEWQVERLAESIKRFGWTVPVLVDEANVVIAGHGRLMAAAKLGLGSVPVMIAAGWTEDEKRAYRIADNQLTLVSEWDPDLLRVELRDLQLASFDIPSPALAPRSSPPK